MPFSETDISLLRSSTIPQGLPALPIFEDTLRNPANQLLLPADTVVVVAGALAPGCISLRTALSRCSWLW